MKKKVLCLALAAMVVLSGCGSSGGVSQEEYDALKKQLEEAQSSSADTSTATVEEDVQEEEPEQEPEKQTGNSVTLKQKEEESNDVEVATADIKEIELVNSWYTATKSENSDYAHINYVVQIKNPNEDYDVIWPEIKITAKAADGSILSSDEMTLDSICAGDTILYGNYEQYEGELPDTVDISVSSKEKYCKPHDPTQYVKQECFQFNNATEQGDSWKKITGELTNNSDVDFSTIAVCVLYLKDGEYIGGSTGYVDDLGAGETEVFEVSGSMYIEDYDSIELYALPW